MASSIADGVAPRDVWGRQRTPRTGLPRARAPRRGARLGQVVPGPCGPSWGSADGGSSTTAALPCRVQVSTWASRWRP